MTHISAAHARRHTLHPNSETPNPNPRGPPAPRAQFARQFARQFGIAGIRARDASGQTTSKMSMGPISQSGDACWGVYQAGGPPWRDAISIAFDSPLVRTFVGRSLGHSFHRLSFSFGIGKDEVVEDFCCVDGVVGC
jgi:hypothetical protein